MGVAAVPVEVVETLAGAKPDQTKGILHQRENGVCIIKECNTFPFSFLAHPADADEKH